MISSSGIFHGTVGWQDDMSEPTDLGDPPGPTSGGTNEGSNLVKVTLFSNRDPSVPLIQGVAQGQQILCQLSATVIAIPPVGARVVVAIPEPGMHVPGNAVILCLLSNTATSLQGNAKPGDVIIPCPAGVGRLALRANGSFAFITTTDGTAATESQFLSFSPTTGFNVKCPFGSFKMGPNGTYITDASGAQLRLYGLSGIPGVTTVAKLKASAVKVDGATVFIGPDAPQTEWASAMGVGSSVDVSGAPAPTLLQFLTALQGVLTPIQGALAALATVVLPGNPIADQLNTALATFTAACAALNSPTPGAEGMVNAPTVRIAL
jgi:hypothetical protein